MEIDSYIDFQAVLSATYAAKLEENIRHIPRHRMESASKLGSTVKHADALYASLLCLFRRTLLIPPSNQSSRVQHQAGIRQSTYEFLSPPVDYRSTSFPRGSRHNAVHRGSSCREGNTVPNVAHQACLFRQFSPVVNNCCARCPEPRPKSSDVAVFA